MELYSSKFLIISEQNGIMSFTWLPESEHLDDEKIRQEFKKEVEFCGLKKPKGLLIDTRDFGYIIGPDLQVWTDKNIFPAYKEAGVEKIAILVSSDVFASASVEQTMSEDEASTFESRYFEDEGEAQKWLSE